MQSEEDDGLCCVGLTVKMEGLDDFRGDPDVDIHHSPYLHCIFPNPNSKYKIRHFRLGIICIFIMHSD